MLDQEFLTQVQEILAACTHEDIQKAVFSATLPAGAESAALDMLRDPIRVVVGLKCVSLSSQSPLVLCDLGLLQRHALAPHCTVPHLRSRRPFEASHFACLSFTTIQPSSPHIHVIATACELPC